MIVRPSPFPWRVGAPFELRQRLGAAGDEDRDARVAQRRRDYLRTRWVPQGWAYIHPVQDVQSRTMEVNAGFASRSEMVLRTGYDAETVDEENAADADRARGKGLQ